MASMRIQMRLLDQNLPGLARELALACWRAVDGLVRDRVGQGLYRSLYRAVRDVFKARVEAFRYCGAARMCEFSLPRAAAAQTPAHEAYAGEHLHVYLTGENLEHELLHATLRAVVERLPGRRLPRLADLLKNHIGKTMEGKLFPSHYCSGQTLCHANEAYDPWDMTDPINAVAELHVGREKA